MNIPRSFNSHATSLRASAVAFAVLVFGGCDTQKPTGPSAAVHPAPPTSSSEVVDYFNWCWRNRAPDVYSRVLTQDFVFEFASGDSTALSWKAIPWGRDDEILSALHLFEQGTASEPPATSIDLQETQAVADDPDPLPGHGSKWHRMLTLQTLLHVNIPGGTWEVRGPAYLFIVRGDSADIPVDLLVQGMKRDSTQWWIEHWVDGTLSSAPAARVRRSPGPAQTMPWRAFTWGDLKALYR